MRVVRNAAVLLALVAMPLSAQQTAPEIIGTMAERHSERMEGIQDYTTTQSAMGQNIVTYFERVGEEAGIPIYDPKVTIVAGQRMEMPEDENSNDMNGMIARMRAAAERATVQGTEDVEGRSAWVLQFTDVADLGWSAPGGADGFTPDEFTLYLDQERYVPLRMTFAGQMNVEGTQTEVTAEITLGDYREVGGMLHPFQMSVRQGGMLEASGMSEEEIRSQIAMMRAQIDQVPEAQRAMVAGVIEEQIKLMESMLAGEPIVMTTTDLKVNTGPPGGY